MAFIDQFNRNHPSANAEISYFLHTCMYIRLSYGVTTVAIMIPQQDLGDGLISHDSSSNRQARVLKSVQICAI